MTKIEVKKIIGLKCMECGFEGKFEEFPTYTYYTDDEEGSYKDTVNICPKCDAEDDFIEIYEFSNEN